MPLNNSIIESFNLMKTLRGNLYRNSHKMDINDDTSQYILIRCNEGKPIVKMSAKGDGDCEIIFSAFPTITDVGTLEPCGNYDFNRPNNATLEMYYGTTVSDVGVVGGHTYIFGGHGVQNPASASAASSFEDDYVVLIPNVDFIIEFNNIAGRDIQVFFELTFFEVGV